MASFLARENNLYGKTNLDMMRIEEVVGAVNDMFKNLVTTRFPKDDADKAQAIKKVTEEDLPKFYGFYEKWLKENGSTGFFVGNSLSVADLHVYDMADNMILLKADAMKNFPLVQKLRSNVESHPKLKVYLANRKKTPF